MVDLPENLKNVFAVIGIICFSSMVFFSLQHLYDMVKLYRLKEGLKRWKSGKRS